MSKKDVKDYYNAVSANYHLMYDRDLHTDPSIVYPADYFRLQMLLNSFINKDVKRVFEVGVGEGTPLTTLGKAGIDVWGVDIAEDMVSACKNTLKEAGLNPEQVFHADIQDPVTYAHLFSEGQFDGLMAMGVMPHVANDTQALLNMATLVRPGGSVFIEFRNKLFSLFTMNRYTAEFILDDLLAGVSAEMKDTVAKELDKRLRMDLPPVRDKVGEDAPGYDAILSKFHNPYEVTEMFEDLGFEDINLLWYHYHPAMPYLEAENPELFRRESLKLEHDPLGWRGLFLCSAFVVEAVKPE